MKKVVLIFALLLFSFNSFAKSDVISDKLVLNDKVITDVNLKSDNMYAPRRYTFLTSCGVTAVSYSYEDVSYDDYMAWGAAMNEFYCG